MTDATTANNRRVLLLFRLGLLVLAVGAGAILWFPERSVGGVPVGILGAGIGILILFGAGYVGLKHEFG